MNAPETRFADPMSIYAKPLYLPEAVNGAGKSLIEYFRLSDEDWEARRPLVRESLDVIDNFRAAHSYPLNAISMTLKNRVSGIGGAFVAQRIKRLESIAMKLLDLQKMKLSQMQDIGGCRAVLPTMKHVNTLRDLYMTRPGQHVYLGEKDYIFDDPKPTGYRSIHLKYRYRGRGSSKAWDNLKIEIQLRTIVQHRWATAVEAAATFTKSALKSNRGRQEWLRFFALMGAAYAVREGCPPIPGVSPKLDDIRNELKELNTNFHIHKVFAHYRTIIPQIEKRGNARYFLVTLDPIKMNVTVQGFTAEQSQAANTAYTNAEANAPKTTNVVLVSVSSVKALHRAYPNYFLDTEDFLRDVSELLG